MKNGCAALCQIGDAVKYRVELEGRNGWSRWVKPKKKGYRMMCCDCGLVHEMDFEYKQDGRGVFIFFRARRHVRATAAAHRARKRK